MTISKNDLLNICDQSSHDDIACWAACFLCENKDFVQAENLLKNYDSARGMWENDNSREICVNYLNKELKSNTDQTKDLVLYQLKVKYPDKF